MRRAPRDFARWCALIGASGRTHVVSCESRARTDVERVAHAVQTSFSSAANRSQRPSMTSRGAAPPPLAAKRLGNAYVQILGLNADSHDVTAPSVLVFTDSHRYVFNVGEGFQRFCVERRLKLQRTNRIMLTRVNAASAGGLTGMLLTMSDGALTAQGAGNGAGNA